MMPGFPSYCAGTLLTITPSITSCRCPRIGHRVVLHAYPDRPPNQVRFRYGPSTSYCFLQTPPLASDALASRILFPVDGARPLTRSGRVCQLRWANKTAPRAGTRRRYESFRCVAQLAHPLDLGNGAEPKGNLTRAVVGRLRETANWLESCQSRHSAWLLR